MTTPTHIHRATATAIALIAIAIPATSAAAEPKNSPPFVAEESISSVSGEPKNVAPFVAAIVHHPTAVEQIIAQERGRRGDPLVFGLARPEPALVQIVHRPTGFDWGDAGIGGAATLALGLLAAGGAALHHDNRRQEAHG